MATKSWDGTVRLWRTDNFECVAILEESADRTATPPPAFHPDGSVIATLGEDDTIIRIWRMNYNILLA